MTVTTLLRKSPAYKPIQDWKQRVAKAGDSVPHFSEDQHTQFINLLQGSGVWQTMINNGFVQTYGASSLSGSLVPLVAPLGVTIANNNFVSTDFSVFTGLDPGITNSITVGIKYLQINYQPSIWIKTAASNAISCFIPTDRNNAVGAGTNRFAGGCINSSGTRVWTIKPISDSSSPAFSADNYDKNQSNAGFGNYSDTTAVGLSTVSRTATDNLVHYRQGLALDTISGTWVTATTPPASPFYCLFAFWDGVNSSATTYGDLDNRIHGYDFMGNGITLAQERSHCVAVNFLMAKLGRMPNLHPDTLVWLARVTAAGGTPLQKQINAIDKAIKYAYNNGLRDSSMSPTHAISYLLCYGASGGFAGCNCPIWDDGVGNAILNNFVSTDWSTAGLIGDGSTKFISTGWNPSTKGMTPTAGSLFQFLSNSVTLRSGAVGFGNYSSAASAVDLQYYNTPNTMVFHGCNSTVGQGFVTSGDTVTTNSLMLGNMTASTVRLLFGGSLTTSGSSGGTGGTVPSLVMYSHAENVTGSAGNFSPDRIQSVGFGIVGLTTAQETALNTMLVQLNTDLTS
jgi:hypothetical protein